MNLPHKDHNILEGTEEEKLYSEHKKMTRHDPILTQLKTNKLIRLGNPRNVAPFPSYQIIIIIYITLYNAPRKYFALSPSLEST